MQVSDDTRSSAIEISLDVDSVALGDYTCTASYHPDSLLAPSAATGTFSVQLESKSNSVYNVQLNATVIGVSIINSAYLNHSTGGKITKP